MEACPFMTGWSRIVRRSPARRGASWGRKGSGPGRRWFPVFARALRLLWLSLCPSPSTLPSPLRRFCLVPAPLHAQAFDCLDAALKVLAGAHPPTGLYRQKSLCNRLSNPGDRFRNHSQTPHSDPLPFKGGVMQRDNFGNRLWKIQIKQHSKWCREVLTEDAGN